MAGSRDRSMDSVATVYAVREARFLAFAFQDVAFRLVQLLQGALLRVLFLQAAFLRVASRVLSFRREISSHLVLDRRGDHRGHHLGDHLDDHLVGSFRLDLSLHAPVSYPAAARAQAHLD